MRVWWFLRHDGHWRRRWRT